MTISCLFFTLSFIHPHPHSVKYFFLCAFFLFCNIRSIRNICILYAALIYIHVKNYKCLQVLLSVCLVSVLQMVFFVQISVSSGCISQFWHLSITFNVSTNNIRYAIPQHIHRYSVKLKRKFNQ